MRHAVEESPGPEEHCAGCALERLLLTERLKARVGGCAPAPILIADFELVRCIGRGHAGIVFEALDRHSGAAVALKHFHTRTQARHVKREFRVLQGVVHRNLVRLDRLFAYEGNWFFTMELVRGVAFRKHVREEGSGFDQVALRAALCQLLQAVAAIHAAGKVHLDLKPGNALVDHTGRVVVLDYGMTRPFTGESSLSSSVRGTPAYMAPEQSRARKAQPASDLYAVGVMLFEALTGRFPEEFADESRELRVAPAELAVGVPEDLDALCRSLLQHDPAARPSAEGALALFEHRSSGTRSLAPAAGSRAPPRFVGREMELACLRQEWKEAQAGQLRVVLIEGDSGMGKTALLTQFCSELQRAGEVLVLHAGCHERERVAFNVFDDIVEQLYLYVRSMPERTSLRMLPRHHAALIRVFPSLRCLSLLGVELAAPPSGELELRSLRMRAFSALRELIARVRDCVPIVIVLDDVHLGDLDSAALTRALFSAPDAPPVLLVAAYRGEQHGPRPFLVNAFGESAMAALDCVPARVQLQALPLGEARELAQALSACDAEAIAREAKGIPFLVCELAAYQAGRAAQGLGSRACSAEDMLRERLAASSTEAAALFEVVCVAARPLPLPIAERAARVANATAALEELSAAKLLRVRTDGTSQYLELYHDRVQQALVRSIAPARSRELHRAIAHAGAALGSDDPEARARHSMLAGDYSQARALAELAAEQCAEQCAWNRAAELFRLVLELPGIGAAERVRLLERQAFALSNAGRSAQAADVYMELMNCDPDANTSLSERPVLIARAAKQLLRACRMSEGLALVKQLYHSYGLRFPSAEDNPYPAYIRARSVVAWLPLPERFDEAPLSREREQALLLLELPIGELVSLDPVRARIAHALFYREALKARHPHFIMIASLWEVMLLGYLGGQRVERRLSRLLRMLARARECLGTPLARVIQLYAEGFYAYACRQAPDDALTAFREADGLLEGEDEARLYFLTFELARSVVAELTGDFEELTSVARQQPRDGAPASSDVAPILTQGVPLRLLTRDRPEQAQRFLHSFTPDFSLPVLDYFHSIRSSDVAFYRGERMNAAEIIAALAARLRRTPLQQSPLFRASFAFYAARSAFTKLLHGGDARHEREIQRQLRITRGRAVPAYNRAYVSLVAAGLALAEHRVYEARTLFRSAAWDFTSSQAFHGAMCARYRLAQLERDGARLADARQWFEARGVLDIERWVSVWAPVPDSCVSHT